MSALRRNAFEVKWRIENVNSWLQNRRDTLYSPQFLAETLMNTNWELSLSTNWHLEEKWLCLTLQRDVPDNGPEFIALNYELSFLACNESHTIAKSCKSKFSSKIVGHELNVKQVEILNEKKETYLPEGVLTVCCRFWYDSSTVTNGGRCSIRSVIGTKCITLDSAIDHFNKVKYHATVHFMSRSSEISLISFIIFRHYNCNCFEARIERKEVESKRFSSHSCKLFYFNAYGEQKEICDSTDLKYLLTSDHPCTIKTGRTWDNLRSSENLQNGSLKLQLQITYNPGVISECVEYDANNCKKISEESSDLENMNTSNSENLNEQLENVNEFMKWQNIEETESSDEDETLDSAGKRHLPSTTLKNDLNSLFNDRLFCDTKLRTDTETFPAHRCVLSARSPVFKKMFTTDMKEAAGECINIPDISSDTVRWMLQFLYTDCTGDLQMQSAKDLYVVSDKYDIASLKQRCLSFMLKNLCPANICDVLVLADMHQDKDLESATNEYVFNHDEEVFGSEEWKLFMQNYSGLAARVMYLKLRKHN